MWYTRKILCAGDRFARDAALHMMAQTILFQVETDTFTLCFLLDAFAVSMQLIASNSVEINCKFGISGFENVITSLGPGATHVQHCITFCCYAAHHNVQQGICLLH